MIATLLARIRRLVRFVRSTYARWRTIRALVRKNPHKMRKLSTGGIEVLSSSIHDYVMMTYNDETGEGENGLDRWAELRRRYSKETFWVPRKDRR